MFGTCFFVFQVKSFIETQRALLAEIQNGCKRNFILAKEKEETEQKMRQSASMAEIATEDGTTEEEEEEPAAEERGDKGGKEVEEKGETPGTEGQTSSQSGDSNETSIPQMILESDSDTEDEEDEEVVTKSSSTSNSSPRLNQTAPQTQTGVAQPFLSASCTSSTLSASPTGGPSVISGITVTESSVPRGTPPSPGRCISVSSPGRGHKIFMVTRVESPPEQLQLQMSAPAAPSQAKEASKKPVDGSTPTTQPTWPPASSQTPTQTQLTQADLKESSAAPSTDCKLKDQSPVAHLESAVNTTLEPQSTSQPTEDATASTLYPEVTDPSQQAPVPPSNSSSVQAEALQLTKEVMESIISPQSEPTCVEEKKEGEEEEGLTEDVTQVSIEGERKRFDELSQTQTSIPAEQSQQPLTIAHEQLQDELSSTSEESQLPNQTEEEEALPIEEKQEAPADLSENEKPSLTEKEDSQPTQEEPCPKQQTEADEQAAQPVLSIQTDQQEPSVTQGGAQELNPPAGEASKSPEPVTTESVKDEDSPDESSADEDECFAEAPEEEIVGSALPNGLKPEFSLHLLDAESPKPGSCVMEHGESL